MAELKDHCKNDDRSRRRMQFLQAANDLNSTKRNYYHFQFGLQRTQMHRGNGQALDEKKIMLSLRVKYTFPSLFTGLTFKISNPKPVS